MNPFITGTTDTLYVIGHLDMGDTGRYAYELFKEAITLRPEVERPREDFMRRLAGIMTAMGCASVAPVDIPLTAEAVRDYTLDDLHKYPLVDDLANAMLKTAHSQTPFLPARYLGVNYLFTDNDSSYYTIQRFQGEGYAAIAGS